MREEGPGFHIDPLPDTNAQTGADVCACPAQQRRTDADMGGESHVAGVAPALPENAVALSSLAPGQWGIVVSVGGEGALRRRFLDMGLIPHTRVLLRKRAPTGDPLELFLRGYTLTLRGEDAAHILMLVSDGPFSETERSSDKETPRRKGGYRI